jgi:uncharacterized membrane protein YesL
MSRQDVANRQDWDDFVKQADYIGGFIVANLLWVAFAIPIVTLPAATAGLFAVMTGYARGQRVEAFYTFFGAMRCHWRTSTAIVLIDIGLGALLAVNLMIFPMMDMGNGIAFLSRSVTWFVAALVFLANLYVWPLLVVIDPPMPLRELLTSTVRLVFAHPVWSAGLLVVGLIPVAVGLMTAAMVMILFSFSGCALVVSWGAWRVIRQHVA